MSPVYLYDFKNIIVQMDTRCCICVRNFRMQTHQSFYFSWCLEDIRMFCGIAQCVLIINETIKFSWYSFDFSMNWLVASGWPLVEKPLKPACFRGWCSFSSFFRLFGFFVRILYRFKRRLIGRYFLDVYFVSLLVKKNNLCFSPKLRDANCPYAIIWNRV